MHQESAALVRVIIMVNDWWLGCAVNALHLEYLLFFQKIHLRHYVTSAETLVRITDFGLFFILF